MQPGLPTVERGGMIQKLVGPALDPDPANPATAVLLGWLFQILLLSQTLPLLPW
jgi:hypothetical protein